MLTHLALKDFAVVRATELEFGPGMTVVSGETGAGKSLMVDALGFLSGLRADSGVVRHGSERAELSADFDLAATPAAMAWLRDNDLDEDGQCQLRRVIRADGGSRAWINGRPATLAQLAELAGQLVEIHGQHEHQALQTRDLQATTKTADDGGDAHEAAVGIERRDGDLAERDAEVQQRSGSPRAAQANDVRHLVAGKLPVGHGRGKHAEDHRHLGTDDRTCASSEKGFHR